jgi:hypothetical protein
VVQIAVAYVHFKTDTTVVDQVDIPAEKSHTRQVLAAAVAPNGSVADVM